MKICKYYTGVSFFATKKYKNCSNLSKVGPTRKNFITKVTHITV